MVDLVVTDSCMEGCVSLTLTFYDPFTEEQCFTSKQTWSVVYWFVNIRQSRVQCYVMEYWMEVQFLMDGDAYVRTINRRTVTYYCRVDGSYAIEKGIHFEDIVNIL